MLEKLTEIVREEGARASGADRQFIPCLVCDMRPASMECFDNSERRLRCPSPTEPDGSLMLARWAVLLVAKGLPSWEEYKQAGIEYRRTVKEWEEAKDKAMPMDDVIYAKISAFAKWTELHGMAMDELTDLIAEAEEGTNGR